MKRLFNIIIYSFIMIVPLIPIKMKLFIFPVSADFLLGGMAILVGFICLIQKYIKDKKSIFCVFDSNIKKLSIFILIFIALSLLSVIYASNKSAAISETLRFLEYVLLFYIVLIIGDEDLIEKGIILLYGVMIIAALFGMFQFVFNLSPFKDNSIPMSRGRVYATFVNPNYWGAAVNMVIFFPLIRFMDRTEKYRSYDMLAFIILLFNLFTTFTRGSWIGFIIGVIILSCIKYRKALLALPVMAGFSMAIPIIRNRFLSIFSVNSLTNSERFKLWKTGILMFKDHFFKGVGNGNYLDNYKYYITKYPELYLQRDKFSVHNSYIKMFAELGIFGGIAFIIIYIMLFLLIVKVYKRTKNDFYKLIAASLLCFWGAYFFQNFFNNLMFIPQLNVFVWMTTAIVYKGYLLSRNSE